MYEAVLFLILLAASVKADVRPFAFVMLANWFCNYFIVKEYGLYVWIPAVDGLAFVAMAVLTMKHPRWWSFLVLEMAFAAVAVHAAYGIGVGFGLYFGREYQIFLNSAFMLSALILTAGGYDISRILGTLWRSIALAYHLRRSLLHRNPKGVTNARKDVQ